LVAFTAQEVDDYVLLQWSTASEQNNAGFAVEHRDGATFDEVGFVTGAGTVDEPQEYEFRIENLEPGVHAFRLRQVDLDGTTTYSSVVETSIDLPAAFYLSEVYPNPFNPTATFSFGVRETQWVQVTMYDALGREVRALFQGEVAGDNLQRVRIDGRGLTSGLYVVQIAGDSFVASRAVALSK
jgi:hypothetical protein